MISEAVERIVRQRANQAIKTILGSRETWAPDLGADAAEAIKKAVVREVHGLAALCLDLHAACIGEGNQLVLDALADLHGALNRG